MRKSVFFLFSILVGCASSKESSQVSNEKNWRDDSKNKTPKKELYEHTPKVQGVMPSEEKQKVNPAINPDIRLKSE
jgi:hypothetical protein